MFRRPAGSGFGDRIVAAAAFALLLSASGPAAAQSTGTVTYPASGTLHIPVTAKVTSHCGFTSGQAPGGSHDFPDLTTTFFHDFTFSVDCTGAFRVAVVSDNGALVDTGAVNVAPGYTATTPYEVKLYLVGDTGSVTQTCDAVTLLASSGAPCAFRGPATTTNGLEFGGASTSVAGSYLRVQRTTPFPGPDIQIASSGYADTLTVTLSPSL